MSRVETLKNGIVVVHNLTINYDEPPPNLKWLSSENKQGLVYDFPAEKWNIGKSGIIEGVDIPILWPPILWQGSVGIMCNKSRERLTERNIGYSVPVELVALQDKEIIKELEGIGILWVTALGQNNDDFMANPEGDPQPVSLGLLDEKWFGNGLFLGYGFFDWLGQRAFVGAPQITCLL
ncbi:TPA: hypothetical protein DD449_01230 [Candidatus Berkelbacteria bacterium]|uniref:Uncharacterized protein n=1 Tax=Berkelbacteria bacterium GW2011_GWE1_39_12 TaxID=1618337 RepID=A0A0G4B5C4_9BACT|nr:MAG: hypothetical protein UT28_C0001G0840 [Berkelbacteria bacterium GW2011_GWE1_39_12]HBO60294.1 hypothetical protein [Candidatus Berkelbacteria bacterium]